MSKLSNLPPHKSECGERDRLHTYQPKNNSGEGAAMTDEVKKAAEVVMAGGVILYPTDTVWGLGCNPNDEAAIQKIARIKRRPVSKSMIVLVNSEQLLRRYAASVPEVCRDLMNNASSPLTIVYPKARSVSERVMASDGSIGIRLTTDSFCVQLIDRIGMGIVSTSANISGQVAPATWEALDPVVRREADYAVDLPHYPTQEQPSQVIKVLENNTFQIIRP